MYQWLLDNVFAGVDLSIYGDIVIYFTGAFALLFTGLICRALCRTFDLIIK